VAEQQRRLTPERAAYIAQWNAQLEPELRLFAAGANDLVRATEGFSFAYLKELFLSSMMHWASSGDRQSMGEVIFDQAGRLRNQMASRKTKGAATA
jgi:hypothetical protein